MNLKEFLRIHLDKMLRSIIDCFCASLGAVFWIVISILAMFLTECFLHLIFAHMTTIIPISPTISNLIAWSAIPGFCASIIVHALEATIKAIARLVDTYFKELHPLFMRGTESSKKLPRMTDDCDDGEDGLKQAKA